jgi:hypothetical protein
VYQQYESSSHGGLLFFLFFQALLLVPLLLTQPNAELRRMDEVAEGALDAILTLLLIRVGEDARLARTFLMGDGSNRHKVALFVSGNALEQLFLRELIHH